MNIGGVKIAPGEQKQIMLNIARLPSRTEIDTPIHVFRGTERGPVLLVMAGLHGDELNGVEAIRRLITKDKLQPKRGTVIAIPVLNVYGFLNFSRDVPDGKDVNRSFPGNKNGSLASRVAWHFMEEVFPFINYGLDMHTGGASRSNYPQIRCLMNNERNEALAKAFAPPFILNAPLRDKSLRKAAELNGKSIIVYEGGEALRLDEHSIKEAMNGALRLMHHLKMIDASPPPTTPSITLSKTSWVRARAAGLFRYTVKNGDAVKKNQQLATISDPFGDFEIKVKSPVTGYIIGVNNMPVINQGDALFHIGVE